VGNLFSCSDRPLPIQRKFCCCNAILSSPIVVGVGHFWHSAANANAISFKIERLRLAKKPLSSSSSSLSLFLSFSLSLSLSLSLYLSLSLALSLNLSLSPDVTGRRRRRISHIWCRDANLYFIQNIAFKRLFLVSRNSRPFPLLSFRRLARAHFKRSNSSAPACAYFRERVGCPLSSSSRQGGREAIRHSWANRNSLREINN
jgi:hypothetical protein